MEKIGKPPPGKNPQPRTLGPVADMEHHLPPAWWETLFNAVYLKTDGDVVENEELTRKEVDLLIEATGVQPDAKILDLCCGQGRHTLELARRGYGNMTGLDRSHYLIVWPAAAPERKTFPPTSAKATPANSASPPTPSTW